MEEQKVLIETVKLAIDKGFNLVEPCTCGGYPECICEEVRDRIRNQDSDKAVYRPKQSLLNQWLRDTHSIHVDVAPVGEQPDWIVRVDLFKDYQMLEHNGQTICHYNHFHVTKTEDNEFFDSYEEALEAGIVYALNLIK